MAELKLSSAQNGSEYIPANIVQIHDIFMNVTQDVECKINQEALSSY